MQKTLVTFSFMLLLKVRAGFPISIFVVVVVVVVGGSTRCRRWGNSLYHLMSTYQNLQWPCNLVPLCLTFPEEKGKIPS